MGEEADSVADFVGSTSSRVVDGPATCGDGSTVASLKIVNGPISYTLNNIQAGPFPTDTSYGWSTAGFMEAVGSSGPNGLKTGFTSPVGTIGLMEAGVEDPTGTIRISDGWGGVAGAAANPCNVGNSLRAIGAENRTDRYLTDAPSKVAARHFDGFNALYGDGHVKWRKWGSTTANEWSIQSDDEQGRPR